MKTFKNIKITLAVLFVFLMTGIVSAQVTTNNGYIYLKNQQQFLRGHGGQRIDFRANHGTTAQFLFFNKTNQLGGVLGYKSGAHRHFGLLDADGNWSYLTQTDSWTTFRINNQDKMKLYNNGQVEIISTRDASGAPNTGALEIGNGLRLDNNEIITNTSKPLHLNYDNNGDVTFDNLTLRVDASENRVGIGYSNPVTKLEVKGIVRATNNNARNHRTEIGHSGADGFINTFGAGDLDFRHHNTTLMSLKDNGKLVIGNVTTPSAAYKLYVEKGILTEKVKVAVKSTGDWSDYVFEEDYEVMPIEQLEGYVAENKHLPNVPSAEEMVKGGLDVATMDAKLLEKIEEAYLYIIELYKEIEQLKRGNDKE